MSLTQFWAGMFVPPIVKWANPVIGKYLKLKKLDANIQEKVTNRSYHSYFALLFDLWILAILGSGIAVLIFIMIYGPNLFVGRSFVALTILGLINMIGVWFIFGGLLDFLFWQISSKDFRDYVIFRQIKSGLGYDVKQQIVTLFKIGLIYYIVTLPIMIFLLSSFSPL